MMMNVMGSLLLPLVAVAASSGSDGFDASVATLISWLEAQGGFFSKEKLEFRHVDPNDIGSPRGLFAKQPLAQNETIMVIPHACLLQAPTDARKKKNKKKNAREEDSVCGAARAILDHYRQGEKSFFKEYIAHLLDEVTHRGKIPDRWSDEGKEILDTILGEELPSPLTKRSFEDDCDGSGEDEMEEVAFELALSRAWHGTMAPLVDMINHRNGDWSNVASEAGSGAEKGAKQDVRVYTIRDVGVDEQLYTKFIYDDYETLDILSDYGLVEEYPQRWAWDYQFDSESEELPLVFDLTRVMEADPYSGELVPRFKVTWATKARPDLLMTSMMASQLQRLQELDNYVQDETESLHSHHERYVIRKYHEALKLTLRYVMWSNYDEAVKAIVSKDNSSTHYYYDTLEKRAAIFPFNEDPPSTCHPEHQALSANHILFYSSHSRYQGIEFAYSFAEDDTCLSMGLVCHSCTQFRIIHEPLIHYPASFLPEVKRVAYVGGGDNLLLTEILKYPSIELVVGMELDQNIVRSCFRFSGARPYFDDPRVEWWFGDATKAVLTLPSSYLGSFDLVIVDLKNEVSDTLKVADTIPFMDALMLLLKEPYGVISKQEDFVVRKTTGYARYTVEQEYFDIAQICRQSFTIGSNTIDFLTAPQFDHNVPRLYLTESFFEPETKFKNWHDFRDNFFMETDGVPSTDGTCTVIDDDSVSKTSTLSKKSGVLMVIEAEGLSGAVKNEEEFIGAVTKALASQGFSVDSVDTFNQDGGNRFDSMLLFREGLVAIRKRSEMSNYVALDIHLWDAIDKANSLKSELLASIGGSDQTASSYRFITGGMEGISKASHLYNYIQEKGTCSTPSDLNATPSEGDEEEEPDWAELIVKMIPSETPSIVVLCGSEGEVCTSHAALRSNNVDLVPLYSCEELTDVASEEQLFSCEKKMMKKLRESKKHKVNGVWLDAEAKPFMARVLLRLLTSMPGREEILDMDSYVIFTGLRGEEWREVFVERFRTEISPFTPAKEARLRLSDRSKFSLFSAGDEQFYKHLVDFLGDLQTRTGHMVTIDGVMTGHAEYVPDFEFKAFTNADFFDQQAYEQWTNQRAIGFQSLFQMEQQAPKPPLKFGERVLFKLTDNQGMGLWTDVVITDVNDDSTYNIKGQLVKYEDNIPRDRIRRLDFDSSALPPPQIDIGTRVLTLRGQPHIWSQGFVLSRLEDGAKYQVWYNDALVEEIAIRGIIPEFEPPQEMDLPKLSMELVGAAFRKSLLTLLVEENVSIQHASHKVGDGCVITALWKTGNAILIWDGSLHLDMNVYMDEEDREALELFQSDFVARIPFLASVASDEQPRGYGGVVNFASELAYDIDPLWWPGSKKSGDDNPVLEYPQEWVVEVDVLLDEREWG